MSAVALASVTHRPKRRRNVVTVKLTPCDVERLRNALSQSYDASQCDEEQDALVELDSMLACCQSHLSRHWS